MAKIIFIEGVSGVGKSTTAQNLTDKLRTMVCNVRCFIEFDATNPIDFYCTAYLTRKEYDTIQAQYDVDMNPIPAGNAVLVRYYDKDTPLFEGELLSQLKQKEFCYNPTHLVSLCEYTTTYEAIWKNFSTSMATDYFIFDGSLLHHPINDMMRNYHVSDEQAASHVSTLLNALGDTEWQLFYLYTDDIAAQLTQAHKDRKQKQPTDDKIAFWMARYEKDKYVLQHSVQKYHILNISNNGWDSAVECILSSL